MTRTLSLIALTLGLAAGGTAASAACYAEYKAKRDNPLELFHDVAQISGPCTMDNATAQLRNILAEQGMTLLKVMSVSQG